MAHCDQLTKSLDAIESPSDLDEIKRITEILASGEFSYTYPYPLKMLLIKYAQVIQKVIGNDETNC
jgi:hypothetical protein